MAGSRTVEIEYSVLEIQFRLFYIEFGFSEILPYVGYFVDENTADDIYTG